MLASGTNAPAGQSRATREAAGNGHFEVFKLLLPISEPRAALPLALQRVVRAGYLEIVKLLLPLSNTASIFSANNFVCSAGCDLLLSCLPPDQAQALAADQRN